MTTQNTIPTPDKQVIKCEGRTKLFLTFKATAIDHPCSYGKKAFHIKIKSNPIYKGKCGIQKMGTANSGETSKKSLGGG